MLDDMSNTDDDDDDGQTMMMSTNNDCMITCFYVSLNGCRNESVASPF